jgi:hypothetical protein
MILPRVLRVILLGRPPVRLRAAVTAVCLACAALALTAGTSALAASPVHFQPEELPALETQLSHHEVHALTFHSAAGGGHIHVSLNDGRHMTVPYAIAEQAQLVALARKYATPLEVASVVAKPKAPVHHKLRYIAAALLVIVIIVVTAVLLVDRRRKLAEAGSDRATDGDPVASSGSDPH